MSQPMSRPSSAPFDPNITSRRAKAEIEGSCRRGKSLILAYIRCAVWWSLPITALRLQAITLDAGSPRGYLIRRSDEALATRSTEPPCRGGPKAKFGQGRKWRSVSSSYPPARISTASFRGRSRATTIAAFTAAEHLHCRVSGPVASASRRREPCTVPKRRSE